MYSKKALLAGLFLLMVGGLTLGYESGLSDPGSGGGGGGISCPTCSGDPSINADFSYSPGSPDTSDSIAFQDQSSSSEGSIVDWSWEFGDGDTSTTQNPSKSFDSAGEYRVTLTVEDDQGNSGSISKDITVEANKIGIPGTSGTCFNSEDDDSDSLTDENDPGCRAPYSTDDLEGLIWDTNMDTTFEGGPSLQSPSPYFSDSFTEMGNDQASDRETDQVINTGGVPEYEAFYIEYEGSEADDTWGYGQRSSTTLDVFPLGTVIDDDRIVLPPNPDSQDTAGSTCGDGLENSNEDRPDPMGDDESNSPSTSDGYDTDCRPDWGRKWERYSIDSVRDRGHEDYFDSGGPRNSGDQTDAGEWCRSDNQDDNGNSLNTASYCEDGDDYSCSPSCGGCGSDGEDGSCESHPDGGGWNNKFSGDEGNNYWYVDGDQLVQDECGTTGSWSETANGGSGGSCSDTVCFNDGEGQVCACSGSDSCSGGSDDTIDGDTRDWLERTRETCTMHNVIDGGQSGTGNLYENTEAGTFTDFTAYSDNGWGSDGRVWCGYDYTTTIDADGPYGYGNGFVVIHQNEIVATENPEGNDVVGQRVWVDGNQENFNYLNKISTNCPGEQNTCIKYANFYTSDSGWSGIPDNPTESDVSSAISVDTKTRTPDESYSVCKNVNRINRENGNSNSDKLIDCDYMADAGGSYQDISPLSEACGDEPGEHLMVMEGSEVSQSVVGSYPGHEQECIDWNEDTGYYGRPLDQNACVLKGKAVSEGTVANVVSGEHEPSTVSGYESGGDSPDREVCLDMRDGNPSTSYTDKPFNYRYDDSSQDETESYGGQWYDLDDERVNEYLRDNDGSSDLDLSSSQEVGDPSFIDYYYGENPNPYDPDYNPEGGRLGTSLLSNCGPLLDSCADDPDARRGVSNQQGTYFGFIQEFTGPNNDRTRDEDYHPEGLNVSYSVEPRFDTLGTINYIKSRSDQLSPGHYDYDSTYNNPPWYRDTVAEEGSAVQYAYTRYMSWGLDSTGVPYPPYGSADSAPYTSDTSGIYYREDYTGLERSDRSEGSRPKTSKAFGNSLLVQAQQEIQDNKGDDIAVGEGYWINPDYVRQEWNSGNIQGTGGASSWRDLVQFKADLSGPDSGLGWDLESEPGNIGMATSNPGYVDSRKQDNSVAFADVYWQGYNNGNVVDQLEAPMCGDDRLEYLLEEKGESPNSIEGSGRYACTNSPDYCVSFTGSGSPLYDYDPNDITYKQTEEPGETESRLKNDAEACAERASDPHPEWYDQDFGRIEDNVGNENLLCQENSLYGTQGVRWIDESQISENPLAFNDGIDDSWNPRLDQQAYSSLVSDRTGANWDLDGNILDNYSPVDTGTNSDRVADNSNGYGFCGGDDSSEYLIYQDSQTERVETDQSIIAISSSPDSCVLDNSRLNDIDDSDMDKGLHEGNLDVDNLQDTRMTYSEGESVTFQSSGASRTIQCFDGQWWGEWPIVFFEEVERFNLGETGFIPFMVINPSDTAVTFDLDLNPRANNNEDRNDLTQITSFESTETDEMTLTVPAQSSSTQRLEIAANREINTLPEGNDFEIEVIGESTDGSIVGDDQVDLVINQSDNLVGSSSNIRDIPGLTFIQLIFIALASTMMFIFRN